MFQNTFGNIIGKQLYISQDSANWKSEPKGTSVTIDNDKETFHRGFAGSFTLVQISLLSQIFVMGRLFGLSCIF